MKSNCPWFSMLKKQYILSKMMYSGRVWVLLMLLWFKYLNKKPHIVYLCMEKCLPFHDGIIFSIRKSIPPPQRGSSCCIASNAVTGQWCKQHNSCWYLSKPYKAELCIPLQETSKTTYRQDLFQRDCCWRGNKGGDEMRRFWQRITQKRHGFIKQGFSMVVDRNVHIQRQKRFTLHLKNKIL